MSPEYGGVSLLRKKVVMGVLKNISERTHNSDAETKKDRSNTAYGKLLAWIASDESEVRGELRGPHGKKKVDTAGHPWWKVMCLSGVDYFSTLGYQPAIAALAAGLLSPLVTLALVVVTLCGALPIYRRVARESHEGAGSIHMLERLLSRWKAKIFVLVLLGFTITDFMITITLSAADAAEHVTGNSLAPSWLQGQHMGITLFLLLLLTAVFLRGFDETINVAVWLVVSFLAVNVVVIIAGLWKVFTQPVLTVDWWTALTAQHSNPWLALGIIVLVFPKIALGMSGFETGVVVMPQIRGKGESRREKIENRVRGAQKLLTYAALTMSLLLVSSSFVTTLLIPQAEFQPGGAANGRALAYLAHDILGSGFGTLYDICTILILWFAGASAMSGLLNLVPRYLPRYGMAPEWARASRPLVLFFSALAIVITLLFNASVDAQGGAYATGVLVLMTSAAVAVTLSARVKKQPYAYVYYALVTLVFAYTTVANIFERPEGIRISAVFVLGIIVMSFISRALRAYERRIESVNFDHEALLYLNACRTHPIHLIAHRPDNFSRADYLEKRDRENWAHHIDEEQDVLFLEVAVMDPSQFSSELEVRLIEDGGQKILAASGASIANTIAAVALEIRDMTGQVPHIYLDWAAGTPIKNYLAFLFFGQGQVASTTHEVLRRAEPVLRKRPVVHVS